MRGQRQSGMAVLVAFGTQILLGGISAVILFTGIGPAIPGFPRKYLPSWPRRQSAGYFASLDAFHAARGKKERILDRSVVPLIHYGSQSSGRRGVSLFLFPHEFRVARGDRAPREILLLRQPASLRQRGTVVLVLQNADQHVPQVALSLWRINRQSRLGNRRRRFRPSNAITGKPQAIPAMALPRREEIARAQRAKRRKQRDFALHLRRQNSEHVKFYRRCRANAFATPPRHFANCGPILSVANFRRATAANRTASTIFSISLSSRFSTSDPENRDA